MLLGRFFYYFNRTTWYFRSIYLVQLALILGGAAGIAVLEKVPFGDAVYFAFITGLTIGYGDIVAHTGFGRIICVALGLVGVIFTGLVVAAATHALQKAWHETHPQ
jgi:voltage-gated potassium channel